MTLRWNLDNWVLLRVAALPTEILRSLATLYDVELMMERLNTVETAQERHGDALVDVMHGLIKGRADKVVRRFLLSVKRDAFNRRSLRRSAKLESLGGFDSDVTRLLDSYDRAIDDKAAACRQFDDWASAAWRGSADVMARVAESRPVADGVFLSSRDTWRMIQGLRGSKRSREFSSVRARKRYATIASYVLRALVDPTPLSSFAAAGLFPLADGATSNGCEISFRRRASVDGDTLRRWLKSSASKRVQDSCPLRVTPIHRVTKQDGHSVIVYRRTLKNESGEIREEWIRTKASSSLDRILDCLPGLSAQQIVSKISTGLETDARWYNFINHLIEINLLERVQPPPYGFAPHLRKLAILIGSTGEELIPRSLERLAELIDSFSSTTGSSRDLVYTAIANTMRVSHEPRKVVHEDTLIRGPSNLSLPIERENLVQELMPALLLAQSCVSDRTNRALGRLFVSFFGCSGRIENARDFLVRCLELDGLVASLRASAGTPPWLSSPVAKKLEGVRGEEVELDPEDFASLPTIVPSHDFAMYVQLESSSASPEATPKYNIILKGIHSGRFKYVSRFLDSQSVLDKLALDHVKTRLRQGEASTLMLDMRAVLELNFQHHPLMTLGTLEGEDTSSLHEPTAIPLSKVGVILNPNNGIVRMVQIKSGKVIEPLHLGFLRNGLLPDLDYLLSLMSTQASADTVCEQVQIYRQLDMRCKTGFPFHRPRIRVGRLILERSRWMVPMLDLPDFELGTHDSAGLLAVYKWRVRLSLPVEIQCELWPSNSDAPLTKPPERLYVNWLVPSSVDGLVLHLSKWRERDPKGFLRMIEIHPQSLNSWCIADNCNHVSEVVLHLHGCSE